jgi:hypothetical protein
MRVIGSGSRSPRTILGALGNDLRASFPPETSASEEITKLLQRLCTLPANAAMTELRPEPKRPHTLLAAN